MTLNASVVGLGAVTSVGLTALQTFSAIRAGISGVRDAVTRPPPEESLLGASVPAKSRLKQPSFTWFVNLASRAISECIEQEMPPCRETALLISLPEEFRNHPAFAERSPEELVSKIAHRTGKVFHSNSTIFRTGHAAVFQAMAIACELLASRKVQYCIVGGVDSLVNRQDYERLINDNRIHRDDNAQGLVPGEASSFILLTLGTNNTNSLPLAQILGVGTALEPNSVRTDQYSVGNGLRQALAKAISAAAISESRIDFLVSDMNGERYRAWESTFCHSKFYRTRRNVLNTWYPSVSVGDTGAASGALNISTAVMALARGYAPGEIAMCEASSEDGLRAGCLVSGVLPADIRKSEVNL